MVWNYIRVCISSSNGLEIDLFNVRTTKATYVIKKVILKQFRKFNIMQNLPQLDFIYYMKLLCRIFIMLGITMHIREGWECDINLEKDIV